MMEKWARAEGVVREFEEGCLTSLDRLRQVVDAMVSEMELGLASDESSLKMVLTFVENLPNGNEKGTYYALDLGGTNFRVMCIEIGNTKSTIGRHTVSRQPVPNQLMEGRSEELFNFIASSMKDFINSKCNTVQNELLGDSRKELGFAFSYPVKQSSVSSGTLIKWTKGFAIKDVVGKDVAECLQQALNKQGVDIHVAALVNDSVGALALGHYLDEDTVAAVIVGTGSNACYVEHADKITKCQANTLKSKTMAVNMEWGNFQSPYLPRTSYDTDLDRESTNPREQDFEKMISGMYLGDIARRVIIKMGQESDIFGDLPLCIYEPFILRTPDMSAMHQDQTSNLAEVARILTKTLQIPEVPVETRRLIVRVCDAIARRAARLTAAGIAGILRKIGRDGTGGITCGETTDEFPRKSRRTVIAIEGGLYSNYPAFKKYLKEAMIEILGEEVAQAIILQETEDGSGIGAALLAASHSLTPPTAQDQCT